MKDVLKMVAVGVLAVMFSNAYDKYLDSQYEKVVFHERLRAGETLDEIAGHYYNPNSEKRTWQEFRYNTMDRNKVLFENGRAPQIGDIVCIEVFVKK